MLRSFERLLLDGQAEVETGVAVEDGHLVITIWVHDNDASHDIRLVVPIEIRAAIRQAFDTLSRRLHQVESLIQGR